MKIGYACINTSLEYKSSTTFRLASFTPEKFISTVESNLDGLQHILEYNLKNDLLFFRISSDLIPFASHPVNTVEWHTIFKNTFKKIGRYIKKHQMRISMHPSQFIVLNSLSPTIIENSVKELQYHATVLDLLGLASTAKIQIHVGGVYGDKTESIKRFIKTYKNLPDEIQHRLAIENDDRLYSLNDCLLIHQQIGIPIIFDNFHHEILNNSENMHKAIRTASSTWKKKDGILMIDYSSQEKAVRIGNHTRTIDEDHFTFFLNDVGNLDFDIMLEIKNKEKSALIAKNIINSIR